MMNPGSPYQVRAAVAATVRAAQDLRSACAVAGGRPRVREGAALVLSLGDGARHAQGEPQYPVVRAREAAVQAHIVLAADAKADPAAGDILHLTAARAVVTHRATHTAEQR